MLLQQGHVPHIRFPGDIEQIAQDRNPADQRIERDIRDHTGHD
jgi:hypothetical protein